jgi:FixJ family two-component response regulator
MHGVGCLGARFFLRDILSQMKGHLGSQSLGSLQSEGGVSMDEGSLTVFVVDDDESVRRALTRLLRSNGYQVVTFESAEDFLQFSSVPSDACLILDIRLQGMSGLDLYDNLACSGMKIPVIFITACDDQQLQARAEKTGPVAYLRKPFGEESLLSALHLACSA